MENIEQEKELGVLDVKIENDYYIVSIRWADGKENEHHFPEKGFPVVDPETKKKVGAGWIDGKKAVKILRENSANMTEEEFSWTDFVKIE
ncbi:MAG: hypothetical protein A3I92_02520 [Candidatus Yanofskybacteria bacterium RIFCSPLOWO2_02_FULL_43_10b]|uniref:Uncharacterized protein n=1 Tax=Candidatus Yanofskybacteria bacterium RIFCSPLOWO2_02_FULL_43_10b TaxID=1802704 RepID=A0A1F8H785_9BACT|nr:MAG: hypothetical protein A3I92_02520 [Candidatus Yanofskybacteria bacterium RIFCSPLOWO2_02_FULL_43_10b]